MTPPRTGFSVADTDQPPRAKLRYGVSQPAIWATAGALVVVWTAVPLVLAGLAGESQPLADVALSSAGYWALWALFSPGIVWLSQHVRLERRTLGPALAVHVPALVAFGVLHVAAMALVRWWAATAAGEAFDLRAAIGIGVTRTIQWEMLTYAAIAAAGHALLYYRESRDRAVHEARVETQLAEAQLTALQKQLHPHFLFNTLNAISTLMHRDVEAADATLIRLSDLLRMSLDHADRQAVTFQRELDFLSRYLEIEQVRFADRLSVTFDVAPDTLDAQVPNFILQPLVENAIKHGVSKKRGTGWIGITARQDAGKLWIEVQDDGVGLTDEAWTALHKGIGVSTTHARLRHLFGADFRFEFRRRSPGLTVIVAIPFRTGHEAAADSRPAPHSAPDSVSADGSAPRAAAAPVTIRGASAN